MSRLAYRTGVLVLALGMAFVAATAVRGQTGSVRAVSSACGLERWNIKTLRDPLGRGANFTLRRATIGQLRRAPRPAHLGPARLRPAEMTAVRIEAALVELRREGDRDFHVVVRQPGGTLGETMIVELPAFACTAGANPARRRQMRQARNAVIRACGTPPTSSFRHLSGSATITGVVFFDHLHGQTGVAPNGIEIHPVLTIRIHRC